MLPLVDAGKEQASIPAPGVRTECGGPLPCCFLCCSAVLVNSFLLRSCWCHSNLKILSPLHCDAATLLTQRRYAELKSVLGTAVSSTPAGLNKIEEREVLERSDFCIVSMLLVASPFLNELLSVSGSNDFSSHLHIKLSLFI